MTQSRRDFLKATAAGAGITVFPFIANASSHAGSDVFQGSMGQVKVHPIQHASLILETPVGVIYVDPVGDGELYGGKPKPDLILITHEHGDHFNAETLAGLAGEATPMITNPAVYAKLSAEMQGNATQIANGENTRSVKWQ